LLALEAVPEMAAPRTSRTGRFTDLHGVGIFRSADTAALVFKLDFEKIFAT